MWRFEWRLVRAERSLSVLIVVFSALVAFATHNGTGWSRFQQRTVAELRAEERRRLDSLQGVFVRIGRGDTADIRAFNDPRVPSVAGSRHFGRWLLLPPAPLEALAIGQSDLNPYFVRLTTLTRQAAVVNDEIENPVTLMTGRLDVSFVMLVLYPLLILALTYNFVSQEREQGTLLLLLSQPVRGRRVLFRKLVVRALVLILVTALLTVIAAIGAHITFAADTTLRLLWWALVVQAYGMFWFAVALATNAWGLPSTANAVAVMGVWFVLVVCIPALASAAVAAFSPVPSRIALTAALRAEENALATAAPSASTALADFLAGHPQLREATNAAGSDPQVVAVLAADQLERRIAPVFNEFEARLRSRQDAADRLRILSPTLAAQSALLDAAGTGPTRARRFDDSYVRAHDAWRQYFNRKIFAGVPFGAADIATLPRFDWVEEPVTTLTARLIVSMSAIIMPALLLACYGYYALRRTRNPLD